jgi:hypothetical protein
MKDWPLSDEECHEMQQLTQEVNRTFSAIHLALWNVSVLV